MLLPFLKARIGGADIDMMPNAFSFPTATGQSPGVWVTSDIVQITGISVPVPVTASTGQFRILDATQTIVIQDWGTLGTIKRGQCLQLRQVSSASYNTTVSMGVNVGKGNTVWFVTTLAVTSGSASWGTPGTYFFTIPHHNNINLDVYGAGGGGGGSAQNGLLTGGTGGTGGTSQVTSQCSASGGTGGLGGTSVVGTSAGGSPGTGSGGTSNYTGGGAGGGAGGTYSSRTGGPGGAGGRAVKAISRGVLTPGSTLTIVVGGGGAGGYSDKVSGSPGGNGAVYISWS